MPWAIAGLIKWKNGFEKASPWVTYWMKFGLGPSMILHPITLIFSQLYLQALPFFGLPLVTYSMAKCGEPYEGMVKSMGLPHMIGLGILMVYTYYRLFVMENNITYQNNKFAFVSGMYFLIINGVSTIFDIIDTYIWYIKKDRSVIRDDYTLQELKKKGRIAESVGNKQEIMKNGEIIGETDEFGFIIS